MRAGIGRILPLLRTCHEKVGRMVRGPANLFWVFHVIRDYVETLKRGNSRFAADLPRFSKLADALEDRQMALPIVLGHHDLLAGNFLDDGKRLWLIDWEYGGFGTPLFDLANIAANGSFSESDEERLLEGYFNRTPSDELRRSFDAMKAASALREAMWAMVSELHLVGARRRLRRPRPRIPAPHRRRGHALRSPARQVMTEALPDRAEVVVIGGGIIGASTAYHLVTRPQG